MRPRPEDRLPLTNAPPLRRCLAKTPSQTEKPALCKRLHKRGLFFDDSQPGSEISVAHAIWDGFLPLDSRRTGSPPVMLFQLGCSRLLHPPEPLRSDSPFRPVPGVERSDARFFSIPAQRSDFGSPGLTPRSTATSSTFPVRRNVIQSL